MRRKKTTEAILKKRLQNDPEASQADALFQKMVKDNSLMFDEFEVDPVMIEKARSKHLKQITIRIGEEQLEEAQQVARETGEKYQRVIRRWLAKEATLSRRQRLRLPNAK